MSDPEKHDAMDSLDQKDEEGSDVEGHSFDAAAAMDAMDQKDAAEEPPDVEGHSFDAMDAMDQKD